MGLADAQVAYAMAGFGAGSILAALLLPQLLRAFTDLTAMLLGGVTVALALLATASMPPFEWFVLGWALLGFGTALAMTPVGRVITRAADSADRAELFAAQYGLSHTSWLVLYPLVGFLMGAYAFASAFAVLALLAFVATMITYFIWRR